MKRSELPSCRPRCLVLQNRPQPHRGRPWPPRSLGHFCLAYRLSSCFFAFRFLGYLRQCPSTFAAEYETDYLGRSRHDDECYAGDLSSLEMRLRDQDEYFGHLGCSGTY